MLKLPYEFRIYQQKNVQTFTPYLDTKSEYNLFRFNVHWLFISIFYFYMVMLQYRLWTNALDLSRISTFFRATVALFGKKGVYEEQRDGAVIYGKCESRGTC